MAVEDYLELARLFGRHHRAPADGLSADVWRVVTARFERLVATWLDEPLTSAGFRRTSFKWVLGGGEVRPIVDVQRSMKSQFEGVIDFTVNWGVWVKAFAELVSGAKKPSPTTATAPYAARIGRVLTDDEDVWWAVVTDGVIRQGIPARLEADPPSPDDEVPHVVRHRLIPMLVPLSTIDATIAAIEEWSALGFLSCTHHLEVDPLVVLRRLAGAKSLEGS